jgi:hypothetical protein
MFSCYEALIIIRKTPRQAFILDDMLLHLALIPGAISFIGHVLEKPIYVNPGIDPRVGISLVETALMACNLAIAILGNNDLFLWHFLRARSSNFIIFSLLFMNQYAAPLVVGWMAIENDPTAIGIELFVFFAGAISTLLFLVISAYRTHNELHEA